MINANEYGFLPENNAYKNSEALQKAIDGGGVIEIKASGIYKISEQIEIGESEIRYEGNKLMLRISKALVDSADGFNFKWADNYIENDVNSFYTKGDAAPYGRLCYCY